VKALLDTNILIHREAAVVVNEDIGVLFGWFDRLGIEKWVHPASIEEINKHREKRVRDSFSAKLESYNLLRALAPISDDVERVCTLLDKTENDHRDTLIVNELFVGHVDFLITEDRGILQKASQLSLSDRTYTIDAFLEKVTAENPNLVDYRVLSVKKTLCGMVDVQDPFFDDFRESYPGFNKWFASKSQEPCYVSADGSVISAYLYLKREDEREPYSDISPPFPPKRRLKVGTFKVALNGFKLGERFLKIIFDNAVALQVEEVYVTIFNNSSSRERLIKLLEDFGFLLHGEKKTNYGTEKVYTRDMTPRFQPTRPRTTYPFLGMASRFFLVSIYPQYHTELFPDSILKTESPNDFIEHQPHRNAIRKVFISRSYFRDLRSGDVVVFYRTGGLHVGVATTVGVVEGTHLTIASEAQFVRLCRKRSVFSDAELMEHWNYRPSNRPFIVDFLYCYSFPKRPNLEALIEHGIIKDISSAPRGFEPIRREQFERILELAEVDPRIVVY
jgi:hypothetical protein